MLVAIDIGNTNITFGIFSKQSGKLLNSGNLKTDISVTTEELAIMYRNLKKIWKISDEVEESVAICSVVPQLNYEFIHMFEKYFKISPFLIENTDIPLKIDYEFPAEIGTDRLINAFGAVKKYSDLNLIIVDFGTATTIDLVSKDLVYLGGIILPGVITSLRALESKAAKIPHIHLSPPKGLIGKNTVECIRSGIFNGHGSMIDELIKRIKEELSWEKAIVIATGGLSKVMKDFSHSINYIEPALTLLGIYSIWKKST